MKNLSYILMLALLLSPFSTLFAQEPSSDHSYDLKPFQESEITAPFFKDSYGYAFFPNVGKGGIGIGGAYGKGQVYRNGKVTGTASLYKVSIGIQLGGQAFSELIFFQDKRAYDEFVNGAFELEASASAVAITAAAQATASTGGTSAGVSAGPQSGKQLGGEYVNGTAIFVHTKGGLMYEAAIGGQKFKFRPMIK
jgi:lipid-binding SYLF domain-containing protein